VRRPATGGAVVAALALVTVGAIGFEVAQDDGLVTGRISVDSPPYVREVFGSGWRDPDGNGCDTRNDVLARDLRAEVVADDDCTVLQGVLDDPYTGRTIAFIRGTGTSDDVQIDHVVALSDAYRHGASEWGRDRRVAFANDPENLLAVEGRENARKGDRGPSAWEPPDPSGTCLYVDTYVKIKRKYRLSFSPEDTAAIDALRADCP
jgi:hypothetical protein